MIVHHLENSRSTRVLWLLEELGLPYEIKRYARLPSGLAPPELKRVHPLGKSPVVEEDGRVLAESGAIIEYFTRKYAALRPAPATLEEQRFTYWLHFAEGSAMPPLLLQLIFSRLPGQVPLPIRWVAKMISGGMRTRLVDPQIRTQLDFMEAELATRPWFAGEDFTAADIQMSFPVEAAAGRAGLDASRPKLWDWLSRIHARPAYQRAIERGGPVEIMR